MLIDGEKWACEACVRGHRVSNCQHADRPLQHINKKGRPVSQCGHCRSMRKSRSSHIKCDCGEKTHKCQHLQQTVEGHKSSCCCNHGGQCTCSHKTEPVLDAVPESESDDAPRKRPGIIIRRRRPLTTHSGLGLSLEERPSHQKLIPKPSKSHKRSPYSLQRSNSMRRTVSRSVDDLLVRPSSGALSRSPEVEMRETQSERASPTPGKATTLEQLNSQLPSLRTSGIRYSEFAPAFDLFGGLSDSEGVYSAGLSNISADWNHFDDLDSQVSQSESFTPSSLDQTHSSFSGLDLSSEPSLTTTSADGSESEDFVSTGFSEAQLEAFQSSSASSFGSATQRRSSLLGSALADSGFCQFKGAAAANKFLPHLTPIKDLAPGFPALEDEPYWTGNVPNFADGFVTSPEPASASFWGPP